MDAVSIRNDIVDRVLKIYPEATRILLFGSRARGTDHPDSDFDLLVVAESELAPARRAALLHLALRDLSEAFDIIVATQDEFERNLAWRSSIIFTAATEGAILYEAA